MAEINAWNLRTVRKTLNICKFNNPQRRLFFLPPCPADHGQDGQPHFWADIHTVGSRTAFVMDTNSHLEQNQPFVYVRIHFMLTWYNVVLLGSSTKTPCQKCRTSTTLQSYSGEICWYCAVTRLARTGFCPTGHLEIDIDVDNWYMTVRDELSTRGVYIASFRTYEHVFSNEKGVTGSNCDNTHVKETWNREKTIKRPPIEIDSHPMSPLHNAHVPKTQEG